MQSLRSLVVISAVAATSALAGYACNAPLTRSAVAAPVAASPPPVAKRTLVLALATGVEDIQTMTSIFRHARIAAEQKKLEEVVVVIYGRGIQAVDGALAVRPPQVTKMIEEAMAAGVKVQVCAHSMEQFGVQKDKLLPANVEVVPVGMATIVDHVARGGAVVRY